MKKNKTVLITGATGFLGSSLSISLINQGYEVIALKRKSSSLIRLKSVLNKIKLFDIEEINFPFFFKKNPNIDYIVHTATSYGRNNETPIEIFEANTSFPLRLLDAACIANVTKFVNTDTILDKYLNLYSLSKNHLLEWGKFYSMRNKIHFVNMKLEHFYGPGDDDSKFTTNVVKSCILNKPVLNLTKGEQKRDFIFIDDVVEAYLLVLNANIKNSKTFFVEYEVGSGNSISVRDFVNKVHMLTNSKTQLNFGAIPYREGEIMNSNTNIFKLKKLGWNCRYNLDDGLNITINNEFL